jgi:5'-3' exonuclease
VPDLDDASRPRLLLLDGHSLAYRAYSQHDLEAAFSIGAD